MSAPAQVVKSKSNCRRLFAGEHWLVSEQFKADARLFQQALDTLEYGFVHIDGLESSQESFNAQENSCVGRPKRSSPCGSLYRIAGTSGRTSAKMIRNDGPPPPHG